MILIGVLYTLMTLGDLIFAQDKTDLKNLAAAQIEFALDLNREFLEVFPQNVFFSPPGIYSILGMLFFGSKGETHEELKDIMKHEPYGVKTNSLLRISNDFLHELENVERFHNGTVMRSANCIITDKTVNISSEYIIKIVEGYRPKALEADFLNHSDDAVIAINDWVKKKTNGKITSLVDSLDPSTKMVLLNAVYFKGLWKFEFDKSKTEKDVFYNLGKESEKREIPFMKTTGEFRYAMFDNFKALELPYKGGDMSMLILLPHKLDGIQTLIKNITQMDMSKIEDLLTNVTVEVQLPKFSLSFETEDLPKHLRKLGAGKIFDPKEADFSSMALNKGLFVSAMIHKAVIEVNEEGTEAAGVTGTVAIRSAVEDFKADHPFLFFIKEKSTNWVLFMGSVISP
ncbi:leukocyte elastase inhibitor A [Trichonephila clavata]|uniref:Leukocyte elastase inhibitor A n=1 Tax=Trichonephila clavata TaxID=2740835 RepID=A0A8X6JLG8_TRICU|nr:leukocyte elastase inhibitor A [Trichonephila clavata]